MRWTAIHSQHLAAIWIQNGKEKDSKHFISYWEMQAQFFYPFVYAVQSPNCFKNRILIYISRELKPVTNINGWHFYFKWNKQYSSLLREVTDSKYRSRARLSNGEKMWQNDIGLIMHLILLKYFLHQRIMFETKVTEADLFWLLAYRLPYNLTWPLAVSCSHINTAV